MRQLIDEYNKLYPNYASIGEVEVDHTFDEISNNLCELKSSFSTKMICKAKDQVVGSYLKLHSLLSLLQSYNPLEWQVKGIIASFAPDEEQQTYLLRQKEAGNRECGFCYNFNRDKRYDMPMSACCRFYFPMNVPDLTLHYISVPNKNASFAVDFNKLI